MRWGFHRYGKDFELLVKLKFCQAKMITHRICAGQCWILFRMHLISIYNDEPFVSLEWSLFLDVPRPPALRLLRSLCSPRPHEPPNPTKNVMKKGDAHIWNLLHVYHFSNNPGNVWPLVKPNSKVFSYPLHIHGTLHKCVMNTSQVCGKSEKQCKMGITSRISLCPC